MAKIRVTVWSEGLDPVNEPKAVAVYPDDINTVIGGFLAENEDMEITLHNIREPENGLTQETIDNTNVLVWWGHMYHDEVSDKVAARVAEAVLNGMGLLLLHSSMGAKPARVLLGKCRSTGKSANGSASGLWIAAIQWWRAWRRSTLRWKRPRCMASPMASPTRTTPFLSAGLKGEKFSAAVSAGTEGQVRFSFSLPVTRNIPSITMERFKRSFATACDGCAPLTALRLPSTGASIR